MWQLICLICVLLHHSANAWSIKGKEKPKPVMIIEGTGFKLTAHENTQFKVGSGEGQTLIFRHYGNVVSTDPNKKNKYSATVQSSDFDGPQAAAIMAFRKTDWDGSQKRMSHSKAYFLQQINAGTLHFMDDNGEFHKVEDNKGTFTVAAAHIEEENMYQDEKGDAMAMWNDADDDEDEILYEEAFANLQRAERQFELVQQIRQRSGRGRRGRNGY